MLKKDLSFFAVSYCRNQASTEGQRMMQNDNRDELRQQRNRKFALALAAFATLMFSTAVILTLLLHYSGVHVSATP